jgi:hypothetical protein
MFVSLNNASFHFKLMRPPFQFPSKLHAFNGGQFKFFRKFPAFCWREIHSLSLKLQFKLHQLSWLFHPPIIAKAHGQKLSM